MNMANICCRDKLLQIYLISLKLLEKAMTPPICGPDITPKRMNHEVTPFIKLLLSKTEELNYRAREVSQSALIGLFRHPYINQSRLIDEIIAMTDKGKVKPDKLPDRIILGRLELVHLLLMED